MRSRGMVRVLVSLVALGALAVALALVDDAPASANQVSIACVNQASDAKTIQTAINKSASGDAIVFRGQCLLTSTIALLGNRSYRGDSASTTIRAASGSNLPALLASDSWLNNADYTGSPISLRDLTIDGNGTGNPRGGDGVVIRSWNSQIENLKISSVRGNGLTIAASSRNGTAIKSGHTQVNGTIRGVYVTGCGGNGIYAQEEPGDNALTDWNLLDSWVGGVAGSGIQLDNGAGWVVAHNHVYDNGKDGISVDRTFATSIAGNNVEDFGAGHAGIRISVQGAAASEIANNRVFQAQPDGGTTFILIDGVVYGTGDVNVSDNVIRGNGKGVGLSYTGQGNPLVVTSTGNSVQDVATPRAGVTPTSTY